MNTMVVKGFSQFTFQKALFGYEYPTVFLCTNELGDFYLFYEIDSNSESESWILSRISDEEHNNLQSNALSLNQFFLRLPSKPKVVRHTFSTESYEIADSPDDLRDVLPMRPLFIGSDSSSVNFARDLFQSIQKRVPMLALRFNPNGLDHGVNLAENIVFLQGVKKIITEISIYPPEHFSVAYHGGSMVALVYPNEPEKLGVGQTAEETFSIVRDILGSKDVESMLEKPMANPSVIGAAKKIIKAANHIGNGLDVFTRQADGHVDVCSSRADEVKQIDKELTETSFQEQTERTLDGTLTGYDVTKHTFSFVANDETSFSGQLDKHFKINQFQVPSKCKVNIKAFTRKTKYSGRERYILIKVEQTSN